MKPRPRAAVGRWSWGILDQGLSSLVNLGLGVAIARSASASAFGAFALSLTIYWVALGMSRSLTSEPFAVRFSASADPERTAARSASGTALLVAALISTGCAVAALFASDNLRVALVTFAAMLPFAVLQDFLRSAAFVLGRPQVAVASDAIWLTGLITTWLAVEATGGDGFASLILGWGLSAGVAAGTGLVRLGFAPHPRRARQWLRSNRDIIPRFAAEAAASAVMYQAYFIAVGAISGLAAVGAMRGAQVLFGPWQVLLMGTGLFALPEAARLLHARGAEAVVRFTAVMGVALASVSIAIGGLLVVIPDSVGEELLGESWQGAAPLVFLTGLSLATTSAISAAAIGLRALAAVNRSLPTQLISSTVIVFGVAIGAAIDDARGALIGITIAGTAAGALWWWQLVRASADYSRRSLPESRSVGAPVKSAA